MCGPPYRLGALAVHGGADALVHVARRRAHPVLARRLRRLAVVDQAGAGPRAAAEVLAVVAQVAIESKV